MTTLHLSGEPDPTQRDLMRGAVECSHDLASPALAEHVAAVREARPPRYGHEVAPMPDGWQYVTEWKSATDLPARMAKHHTAVAYGWEQALWKPDVSAEDSARAVGHLIPAYELAWVWTGIANAGARARRDDWPIDLARDIVTDLVSPQVFGPNLLKLLKLHGIDPATIRPYGGAK